MNRRADVPAPLAQSNLSLERITFYSHADAAILADVGFGVLFVIAFWSAASRKSWARLAEVLGRLDPTGRLEVVVVDTDGLPELPLGSRPWVNTTGTAKQLG